MNETSGHRPDYERSDVGASLLMIVAAGITLFLVGTPYMLAALYPQEAHVDIGAVPQPSPPPPHLQLDPPAELAALRQAEQARLSGYAWVDRPTGVVRMPIDRALALTAERGLPGWTSP